MAYKKTLGFTLILGLSGCHVVEEIELGEGAQGWSMSKIEVFNALQTRFSPSKYPSLKTMLPNATPN